MFSLKFPARWTHFCSIAIAAAAVIGTSASAQVVPSAYRHVRSFWVGGEYSTVEASFPYQSTTRLAGYGIFADYNFTGHIGVEGDARFLNYSNFYGETESSYLAGPRYLFLEWRHLQPYGKALVGIGKIHYPFSIGDDSYFAIAPGGGVNYRLSHRWTIRAEYEYQFWPNSPGFSNEPKHPLHPNGLHIGIAFRPFR